MNARILSLAVAAVLLPASALAQDDVLEKVVVRNRLYNVGGRTEVGLNLGFTILSRLTEHYNANAHFAYNLSETFAFEVRAGYAYSRHTSLAKDVEAAFAGNQSIKDVDDLSDLWEMTANGSVGVRWAPMYGKLSLMAEVPVHFQAYLWLGAGGGQFKRQSLLICVDGRTSGECGEYFTEQKVGPFASGALGLRFFLSSQHALKVELRDFSWPDSYLVDVPRDPARTSRSPAGSNAPNPGVTNLVTVDLGYSFIF